MRLTVFVFFSVFLATFHNDFQSSSMVIFILFLSAQTMFAAATGFTAANIAFTCNFVMKKREEKLDRYEHETENDS